MRNRLSRPLCRSTIVDRPLFISLLLRYPLGSASQGAIQRRDLGTTALGHVRAAAALATHRLRGVADQVARLDAGGQILGHAGDQHDLAVQFTTQQDHRRAQLVLQLVDQRQQGLAVQSVKALDQHVHAAQLLRLARQVVTRGGGGLGLELLQILLQLAVAINHRRQLVEQVVAGTLDQLGSLAQLLFRFVDPVQRRLAGNSLDASHAGGDAAFGGDAEQADIAGTLDVGPPAEFNGEAAAHGQDANLVAVFLTEQRHGALGLGGLDVGDFDFHRRVGADLVIDDALQLPQLLGADGFEVAEVETQALTVDQRALLLHMLAQHLAQRGVQQVGGGMVALGRGTHAVIDHGANGGAAVQAAAADHPMVQVGAAGLGGIAYVETHAGAFQVTGIAHLPAGFGIEGGLVQQYRARLAFVQAVDLGTVPVQRQDLRRAHGRGAAVKAGLAIDLDQLVVIQAELAGRAGALALGRHGGLEAGFVDGQVALTGDITRQVHGEAVGVVQFEDHVTGNLAALELRQILLKDAQALLQRLGKLLFFGLEHTFDVRLLGFQLREGVAHLGHQRRDDAVEEGTAGAQLVAVPAGAADDATQHVAAALVGRQHAVGNQKAAGTDMVGHHLQRRLALIGAANGLGRRVEQALEQVDLVVGVHMLQHCTDALQAHAGIDAG